MSAFQRLRPQRHQDRIAAVETELVAEFGGIASPATVSRVVLAAQRDLDGEVPTESLEQFLHGLARQRLLDVCAAGSSDDSVRTTR